jgi:hypothetical protein
LRPIDILTGEIAIEVTGVVGVSPALWYYFRYIASIFFTLHKRLCFRYIANIFFTLHKRLWLNEIHLLLLLT